MYKYQGTYYFPTTSPLIQDTLDKMSSACSMIHLAIVGVYRTKLYRKWKKLIIVNLHHWLSAVLCRFHKMVFCIVVNHCILVLKLKFYPRIFPFIRHWYNVHVEEMHPLKVTSLEAGGWRFGLVTISLEPFLNHVVVKLFTPQQTSICLSRHLSLLLVFHGNFLKKISTPFFHLNIVSQKH